MSATDRSPDVGSPNIHVIYAFPADGADRFAERAHEIVNDLAAIDLWWRRQDPTRAPRFDLFPFPGCTTKLGALDISKVRLPQPSSYYAPDTTGAATGRSRHLRIQEALNAAPFEFGHPAKKYLGFYDAPTADDGCAGGTHRPTDNRWIVRLRVGLPRRDRLLPRTPADAGEPPESPPTNSCTCWALCRGPSRTPARRTPVPIRPMSATARRTSSPESRRPSTRESLDVGRDDYYGHSGSWWDVQDSPYLGSQIPLGVTVSPAQGTSGQRRQRSRRSRVPSRMHSRIRARRGGDPPSSARPGREARGMGRRLLRPRELHRPTCRSSGSDGNVRTLLVRGVRARPRQREGPKPARRNCVPEPVLRRVPGERDCPSDSDPGERLEAGPLDGRVPRPRRVHFARQQGPGGRRDVCA